MLDGLGLTEVCVDTSVAVELFRDRDFSELRLMKFLQSRSMHLSITEIAMSEVLVGTPADRFRRFCNVAALARCAGHNWFSLGAPLYWTHKYELEFHEHAGQPRVPRHAENELEKIIARADSYAVTVHRGC